MFVILLIASYHLIMEFWKVQNHKYEQMKSCNSFWVPSVPLQFFQDFSEWVADNLHVDLLFCTVSFQFVKKFYSENATEESHLLLYQLLPNKSVLEDVAIKLLNALIKQAHITMAKNDFNSQLEILKKVKRGQVFCHLKQ